MLPTQMPFIRRPPIVLRPFRAQDAGLVQSVASDPLIPLITTVPAAGDPDDARAYIERQHDRLAAGEGYSFAIADAVSGDAVGQIGLWLRNLAEGRVSTGYWVASQFRRRGYAIAALAAISRWACLSMAFTASNCTSSRGIRDRGGQPSRWATSGRVCCAAGSR
jgi:[ribosomal protein S5]-alanine N-acetyltransferase